MSARRTRPPGSGTRVWVFTVAMAALSACTQTEQDRFPDLLQERNELEVEIGQLEDRLAGRDAKIASLEAQLQNLRDRGVLPPAPVFGIDHLEILDVTSGTNTDGVPGDDAVTVYLRPVDKDGDVLKRAGKISIKLLDNTPIAAPVVLGTWVDDDHERIRKLWYGKFWTNHYKIDVPFFLHVELRPGQEVDVHVTFIDFATGRPFTGRKMVKINVVDPD